MSTYRLLERTRRASQLPLRQAHVAHQARQLGDCVCGAPLLLHYRGPGANGGWRGCDAARRRMTEAVLHEAQSAADAPSSATQTVGVAE